MIVCEIKTSDLSFNFEKRESESERFKEKKIVLRACVGSNIIERDFFYDKNFERKTNVLTCVNLIATKK